ncbi:MAG: hypothetical protein CVT60_04930 [Actinobacteria bacterium HGW-Actinobacteria-10]|jgi:hypothetical protein|nr:MAG: hypothetical protein CVT60_04930 [Actinobacteria bacterium HGW-Actinobacteria-10]
MSELHEAVLAPDTARVFRCLGSQSALGSFYLAGGTGAALQMGHRISEDLDLFTERPWSWSAASAALTTCGEVVVDRQEEGTFVGSVGGVRVSLFHYPYVLLEEPRTTPFGLPVAGLEDIGCMKLVAASQRGSRKDFVDLYFLAGAGLGVRELMQALARKMPAISFNPVHILKSLAYFEDAESEPEPTMLVAYDWRDVRAYCTAQAEALLQELLDA